MPKRLETWQLWNALRKHLGESFLIKVLGKKNARTVRLYSQDPRFTEDRCKDPLEALHIIFSAADEIGRGDLARKAIAYLQSALEEDGRCCDEAAPVSLKDTMEAEQLEDFRETASFHQAINDGAEPDMVETLLRAANDANERTYAKYLEALK